MASYLEIPAIAVNDASGERMVYSLAANADRGQVLEFGYRPGLARTVAAENLAAHTAVMLPDDHREDEAAGPDVNVHVSTRIFKRSDLRPQY